MAIYAIFGQPGLIGSAANLSVGAVRTTEVITAGSAGSEVARDGEMILLLSTEAGAVYVAYGVNPSAAATASTSQTSARFPLAPNIYVALPARRGDQIATATI